MAVIQGSPENKQKRRLEKPVLLGLKRHTRGLTTGEGETGWKDGRTVPDTADPN